MTNKYGSVAKFILIFTFLCQFSVAAEMKGVNWFKGSVEQAFVFAKKENRPLFLYWGAVWCPPCNRMKKTVFSTKKFQNEIKNYVAVYLDGDDPEAQIWGDKLQAKGYPTMLILDSDGKELNRLPIELGVNQYISLMKETRKSLKSVSQILTQFKKDSKKLSPQDWKLLGGYSWYQKHDLEKDAPLFKSLLSKVPEELSVPRSRFFTFYLRELLKKKDQVLALEPYQIQLWDRMIGEEKLSLVNVNFISEKGALVLKKVFREERKRVAKLIGSLRKLRNKNLLTLEERVLSFYPEVVLRPGNKGLNDRLLKEIANVDSLAKDAFSRQDAMSTVVWILEKKELYQQAFDYALKETKRSLSPHYFYSKLGRLSEKMKRPGEAMKWYNQAWMAAKGNTTRYQWGSYLVRKQLELKQAKSHEIVDTFKTVHLEWIKNPDAFSGRNLKRLKKLAQALNEWDEGKSKKELAKIIKNSCKEAQNKKDCRRDLAVFKL